MRPATRGATDSCPPLPDSLTARGPSDSAYLNALPILDKLRRLSRYVSILIDGQREAWNQDLDSWTTGLAPGLAPSDVERIEIWWPGTAPAAYQSCPGVTLILITTTSKKYHPPRAAPE